MKIIHILLGKANPNTMNGVNKVVHHLATEQVLLNIDVEVWGITSSTAVIRHNHNYPLKLYPYSRSRFFIGKEIKKAICNLSRNTMIHFHSVFLPEMWSISKLLKKRSIEWVLTPHCGYLKEALNNNKYVKCLYMALFEKFLIKNAAKIHAIGVKEIGAIKKIYENSVIEHIPNGQSLNEVVFEKVNSAEPNSRPLFGYCGRLALRHKGLDLLIESFSKYKNSGGKGELWIIGSGPDEDHLKVLVMNLNISKSVRFFGPLFGDEKYSHLDQIDVFVHTSRWDGIPTAVLEAAALRKMLVVSVETNLGEYVDKYKCGYVIRSNRPSNITNILQKIDEVYRNGQIGSYGEKSYLMINEDLNWRNINKRIVHNLYGLSIK